MRTQKNQKNIVGRLASSIQSPRGISKHIHEEYFDIVDDQNNPTGQKISRNEAHKTGTWHRTVHLYLYRQVDDGFEFLVHLRSKQKDMYPNRWDTRFGGHVKTGESIEEAIQNEVKEEIGLAVNLQHLLKGATRKHQDHSNNEFVTPFFLEVAYTPELKFNDGEVQRVGWMSDEGIIKKMKAHPEQWSGSLTGFTKRCEELYNMQMKLD